MSDNVSNIRETGLARSKKALLEFNVGIELLYQYLSTADNKQYFLICLLYNIFSRNYFIDKNFSNGFFKKKLKKKILEKIIFSIFSEGNSWFVG